MVLECRESTDKNRIRQTPVIYRLYFCHIETLMNDRPPKTARRVYWVIQLNILTYLMNEWRELDEWCLRTFTVVHSDH